VTDSREETAKRFAEAMGWEFNAEDYDFACPHPTIANAATQWTDLPAPNAPLHSHLAFVGRVAEALGMKVGLCFDDDRADPVWAIAFFSKPAGREWSYAMDLSWAAMLAALAAKESR
jgi:hypothetical protein